MAMEIVLVRMTRSLEIKVNKLKMHTVMQYYFLQFNNKNSFVYREFIFQTQIASWNQMQNK